MPPPPTTIILNPELNHSVTYDPSDDTVTANLIGPTLVEKVPNKPKLMLLIYFVQRDLERKNSTQKSDVDVSIELQIVERIIWQFSNYAQALRTLKEYTETGNRIDTSAGMAPNRTEKDGFGKGTKAIRMIITSEVKEILVEWMQDILDPGAKSGDAK